MPGLFAAAFSYIARAELSGLEIQCYSMGEEFLGKFLVGASKRINAAQFWSREGPARKRSSRACSAFFRQIPATKRSQGHGGQRETSSPMRGCAIRCDATLRGLRCVPAQRHRRLGPAPPVEHYFCRAAPAAAPDQPRARSATTESGSWRRCSPPCAGLVRYTV